MISATVLRGPKLPSRSSHTSYLARRVIPRTLVLGATLLVAGCESAEWAELSNFVTELVEPASNVESTTTESRPTTTTRRPNASRATLSRATPRRKAAQPDSDGLSTDTEYDPRQLVGQSGTALTDLLGPPATRSEQASGLVWSFRSAECELNVVLYSSVDGTDLRVLQYRVDGNVPDEDPNGAACVGRMVNDARTESS